VIAAGVFASPERQLLFDDRAVGKFAKKYADQTERDYEAFLAAIHSGRLQATEGV